VTGDARSPQMGGRAVGGWTLNKPGFLVFTHSERVRKRGVLCLKQCSLKTAPHLDN
jgi:hypothetical protein